MKTNNTHKNQAGLDLDIGAEEAVMYIKNTLSILDDLVYQLDCTPQTEEHIIKFIDQASMLIFIGLKLADCI